MKHLTVIPFLFCFFLCSCNNDTSTSPENNPSVTDDGGDLSIGWISRSPEMEYVWGSPNPTRDGWPSEGQSVAWKAHVKNWSKNERHNVTYRWLMDGVMVDSGSVALPAQSWGIIEYPWIWQFARHELTFLIDPQNRIMEEEERNNELKVFTDALSVGFYVEQSLYDYFRQNQKKLNVGSNTWEDWAQRHLRRLNQMFASAINPETPDGVFDRVRLDKVVVVPDGALPLVNDGSVGDLLNAEWHPNLADRTVDLQWGFPVTVSNLYTDPTTVSDNNPFYYAGYVIHELGHARYLVDVYGFNVYDGTSGGFVDIEENGQRIAGSGLFPGEAVNNNGVWGLRVYKTKFSGLMNAQWTYIDHYSAMALNLIAGHRATRGNYMRPENIGSFLNDLPDENQLLLKDNQGNILSNAEVQVYQASLPGGAVVSQYARRFDNSFDLNFVSNEQGHVFLGKNPFSNDGLVHHTVPYSNAALILRVSYNGKVGYTALESSLFNMEYWRGNTALGSYEVTFSLSN